MRILLKKIWRGVRVLTSDVWPFISSLLISLTLQDLDSVSLGSFVISPRNFHIPASGGRVNIQVVFTPTDMGQFSEDISMACDNGQVLEFTITGYLNNS